MCEHTVLKNGWDHIEPSDEIPKAKSADDLRMERIKRIRELIEKHMQDEKNEMDQKRKESIEYMNLIKDAM